MLTTFFQNQCSLHKTVLASIGIPLVSGIKKYTKADMTRTKKANRRKIVDFIAQSVERKACAIKKVNNKFTDTTTLRPADLSSNGNVSLGISHPIQPHEYANAITNTHIIITVMMPDTSGRPPVSWSPIPSKIPITACEIEKTKVAFSLDKIYGLSWYAL